MALRQALTDDGVTVACFNDAVPADTQPRYLASGTFVFDFGTGHSFRSEDTDQHGAPETFNRAVEASQAGGIGTIRAGSTDLIAVGRFGTDCVGLLDRVGDRKKDLKTLQFEEYALVAPGDDRYDEIRAVADTKGGTVAGLTDAEIDTLRSNLERLGSRGRLRTPVR